MATVFSIPDYIHVEVDAIVCIGPLDGLVFDVWLSGVPAPIQVAAKNWDENSVKEISEVHANLVETWTRVKSFVSLGTQQMAMR